MIETGPSEGELEEPPRIKPILTSHHQIDPTNDTEDDLDWILNNHDHHIYRSFVELLSYIRRTGRINETEVEVDNKNHIQEY